MQFLITATFAVIALVGMASPCTDVCRCTYDGRGLNDHCGDLKLSSIPTDIPTDTAIL